MIARGDLAVECGYERLAEIQEEILWMAEASHTPVIWATQVLESLAKSGIPSRAEITDAAMGERAECVMLNKGPYILEAVRALDNILTRMQDHQRKFHRSVPHPCSGAKSCAHANKYALAPPHTRWPRPCTHESRRRPPPHLDEETTMKLIKAVVRPNKIDDVKDALAKLGVDGLTVTEVRGHGKQKGHAAIYRGKEYQITLLPKIEVEVVVDDKLLEPAVGAIVAAARTGEIGDGRVFVSPVEQTFRIRTGEAGLA
jgi:nitrogen regulatory protein PII